MCVCASVVFSLTAQASDVKRAYTHLRCFFHVFSTLLRWFVFLKSEERSFFQTVFSFELLNLDGKFTVWTCLWTVDLLRLSSFKIALGNTIYLTGAVKCKKVILFF